jgi:hypothetical protein
MNHISIPAPKNFEESGYMQDSDLLNYHLTLIVCFKSETQELSLAKHKFPYVDKWLSNDQIKEKLSNHFWKNDKVTNAQITQTLKLEYAQYMGNHTKNIFWPLTHQNPNCTLCHKDAGTHGPIFYQHVNTHT